MHVFRFLVLGVPLVACVIPASAQPDPGAARVWQQPEVKPQNKWPFPFVSPEEAARLGERPIALHLRDMALSKALDELQHQSGVTFEVGTTLTRQEDLAKTLSLDLETRSFSAAFTAILDEAEVKAYLSPPFMDRDGKWLLISEGRQPGDNPPQSVVGPFSAKAVKVHSLVMKDIALGTPPEATQNAELSVEMSFGAAPLLPVDSVSRVRFTRADDETGHSLLTVAEPDLMAVGGLTPGTSSPLRLRAQLSSHKLTHLDGVVTWLLIVKRDKWQANDVLNAKNLAHEFQSDGQTFRIEIKRATRTEEGIQINVELRPVNAKGNRPSPVLSYARVRSSLRLLDATGHELSQGGGGGSPRGNSIGVETNFYLPQVAPRAQGEAAPQASPDGPFTLVFDVPTEFVQTQVPFSFSDLPLP